MINRVNTLTNQPGKHVVSDQEDDLDEWIRENVPVGKCHRCFCEISDGVFCDTCKVIFLFDLQFD